MLSLFARSQSKVGTNTPAPRGSFDQGKVFANLDKLENLPHLSDTAVRAMALCNNPDASLAEMIDLIRRDGVMVAGLLKLANSVVYRGSSEVNDLQQAVVRIGMKGCRSVIAAAGMRNLYAKMPGSVKVACENVLRHSLFVGGLATAIARSLRLSLSGEEYTAGLLHDIGRVVMCVNAPEQYATVFGSGNDADPALQAVENQTFGTDHGTLGKLFAVKNNLPAAIGQAIQHHHTPEAEREYRPLTAVVALADGVANHLQQHRTLENFPLDTNPAFEMLRRLVVSERIGTFPTELKALVVACVRDTRSTLKSMND
ncbi:MAG: HDOD domain-containing protein [Fimbriiglobus sp.]|jgi:putative nucleotidyltransferase with HDIG domain|nr:HDOD domain-containing protein [Fimbriiglobus sp.]